MNSYELGKSFEEECYHFLCKLYDVVIWHSNKRWTAPIDFECYKDGERVFIDAKRSRSNCNRTDKPINFYLTKIKNEFTFINPQNIKKRKPCGDFIKIIVDFPEEYDKLLRIYMINNEINTKAEAVVELAISKLEPERKVFAKQTDNVKTKVGAMIDAPER